MGQTCGDDPQTRDTGPSASVSQTWWSAENLLDGSRGGAARPVFDRVPSSVTAVRRSPEGACRGPRRCLLVAPSRDRLPRWPPDRYRRPRPRTQPASVDREPRPRQHSTARTHTNASAGRRDEQGRDEPCDSNAQDDRHRSTSLTAGPTVGGPGYGSALRQTARLGAALRWRESGRSPVAHAVAVGARFVVVAGSTIDDSCGTRPTHQHQTRKYESSDQHSREGHPDGASNTKAHTPLTPERLVGFHWPCCVTGHPHNGIKSAGSLHVVSG